MNVYLVHIPCNDFVTPYTSERSAVKYALGYIAYQAHSCIESKHITSIRENSDLLMQESKILSSASDLFKDKNFDLVSAYDTIRKFNEELRLPYNACITIKECPVYD